MENDFKYQLLELENKIIKNEIKEFKRFAFKGDMIKISIGIILGNSFNGVVKSISDNLVMPVVNFVMSKTGNWRNWNVEIVEGMDLEIGKFLGSTIDFLLTAIFLYLVYVKLMKNLFEEKEETDCVKN